MGMFAASLRRQQQEQVPRPFEGGLVGGGLNFVDDVALDPSQVEFMPGWDDQAGHAGPAWSGGAAGGGGGGSWLADLAGWAPPVQDVGDFAAMSPMQGLLGFLGMGGESMGMGVGAAPGAPRASGGGGFTAAPSGPDFRGPDFNPQNLVNWQGLVGVPQAIRTLATAEKQLGLPGLSDAVTGVGFRTRDEQAAARARYLAGQGALAAPPGSSFHEQGEAFDISSSWLSANPKAQPWLERHGFTWDVAGEPWHAHYVGGGAPLRPASGNQNRPISTERKGGRPTTSGASPLSSYRRR